MKTIYYIAILFLVSCGKKPALPPVELIQWIENSNNGLQKQKSINGINYNLQFQPAEYVALKESNEQKPDVGLINKRAKELEGFHSFNLRISISGQNIDPLLYNLTSQEEYNSRDMFFAFGFQKSIKQIYNTGGSSDTLYCNAYHFIQNHGLTPYMDCVFMFPKKTGDYDDFDIVLSDDAFGTGMMKFSYTRKELENLPKLLIEDEK